MARTITLKYDATCLDCGTKLAAGERARYYGRGRVYGTECHEQKPQRQTARGPGVLSKAGRVLGQGVATQRASANIRSEARQTATQRARADVHRETLAYQYSHGQISEAQYRSACDPTGFYNANGECIGRVNPNGRCEDAPCCGCCS